MDSQGSYMGDAWQYDPNYQRTAEFLGIDKYDRQDLDVYKKISHFDTLHEGKELPERLQELENLRKKIGSQSQGRTLLNQLYQYSKLSESQPIKPVVVKPKKQAVSAGSIEKYINNIVTRAIKDAMKGKV